ncbi:Krueppel-related zinc finger protein 1 [Orchesella cincta]|uniref:Krueppel-related zinc finger protein 1 n=1 Tax=Orchesella cincta TaxID=48709 RepID=A0A1D2N781_ORCCI|nr:Krueppel-related zinc finger protein 1 [Orchesella cincta]
MQKGSLDSHLISHKPPEKTYDCEKCGMQFHVKANLRQHMRTHSDNPKKFPCDFCPSGFSKRVNLRYHIKRKHPEEAEKMNNNNNSNDSGAGNLQSGLAMAEALSGTILPNNNAAAAALPSCGDTSKDNKNQGSFKCEHCDRAFLFKNNLKAHLRTHTRDKKYTCDLCGKSFIYKESLKNHMLLHSNELPYLCDICGKKFRDRSNRRKHVKNVHKYLFINGDINNPVKPGTVTPGSSGAGVNVGVPGATSAAQPGEPPTKKKKVSKKAAAAAAAAAAGQQNPAEQMAAAGQDNSNKTRSIIKSPAAPRGKKAKTAAVAATKTASNTKSVIVSASTTGSLDTKVDRKIIMSPSPKNTGAGLTSSSVGSPSSLEYVHSHSSLPVTVHVPMAGSQGQFSHGRNIIVKAASSASSIPPNHQSPPALSPEITNLSSSQDSRGSDPSGGGHPYGSGGTGNPSHPPMEIQVVNAEYSHLYPADPNSLPYEQHHHYHWTSAPPSAPPGMDHGNHPPNSSSPYELVAPPAGSNGSSSGLVNEGPGSHQHPPVSIAQSYDSGGINPGSNALSAPSAIYATGAAQGHEVLDPSGNGGFFYKDDFDFSYL